jgi:hypothetical protein
VPKKRRYRADLFRTVANEDNSIGGLRKKIMVLDAMYGAS